MKFRFTYLWLLLSCAPLCADECDVPPPSGKNIWWADAEFLYWKTFLSDGIEFADSFDPLAGALASAHGKYLKFRCSPGFRLKLGYVNQKCLWDACLNYTFYHNHSHSSVSGVLFPTFHSFVSPAPPILTGVTDAKADWHLNFQYVDLDFGRSLWWGSRFALHPHFGIRGAFIRQHGEIDYAAPGIAEEIRLKNHFCGAGLKTGLDGHFQLSKCFSLFGDFSTSLLWGRFEVSQQQIQNGALNIDLDNSFSQLCPTLQSAVGIAWQRHIARWCPLLVLSAAVERQYWWRQNHIQRFVDNEFPIHTDLEQDLAFFGLTVKATVYF